MSKIATAPRLHTERQTLDVFGAQTREQQRHVCTHPDGTRFVTGWYFARHAPLAEDEMRRHIEAEHPELVPYGLCVHCGEQTDYFHADSALGTVWMCEACAPAIPGSEP